MPTTLGEKAVGSIVTLRENGVPQNYIVVHQGNPDAGLYDASCDGTWLLRQNIYANANEWSNTNNNTFSTAIINLTYLPSLLNIYDAGIQANIKTVKIPYCVGDGQSIVNSGSNGWECQLFLLGGYEVGFSQSDNQYFPIDGVKLDYFLSGTVSSANQKRVSLFNGVNTFWWLRSPNRNISIYASGVGTTGFPDASVGVGNFRGIRPAMILPTTMTVNDDNSIQNPAITTGQAPVGSIVKVKENGVPVDYIVVNQGIPQNSPLYDSSCNGTWLLRKDIYANAQWNSTANNTFTTATINTQYLPNTILSLYDSNFQNVIKQVKIPYCVGNSNIINSGSNGWECQVFPLSGYEVGFTQSNNSNLPIDGDKLDYFILGTGTDANNKRVAKLNNNAVAWWSRTPQNNSSLGSWMFTPTGTLSVINSNLTSGIRPAFILPTNLIIDSDNNILSQSFTITVPSIFMEGQPIPISWTPWTLSTGTVTYTIQRNTGSSWVEVASGLSTTTYTDTAQAGWSSVQYQITVVVDGVAGPFFQSAVIPGIASAVIAISGIDGNLGTLTSNVQYTVVSNTGNQISLTRTVNGAQVVTLTVDSGFAYNIPIADLPTGTGTIVITASVEDTSQEIQTATRTWTYYKTPINIPSTGGIAQLTQNGQNIWPVTVPDAVEAPVYLGGNLNAALNKLGQAALYTKIGSPKYNEVTVDLSKVNVGDEVLLPENGVMVSFYVGSLNYEPTLNTSGNRVLLIRKESYTTGQWNTSGVNTYENSTIDTWLNNVYKPMLDSNIQNLINSTTFYYIIGDGLETVSTLTRSIFILSASEMKVGGMTEDGTSLDSSLINILTKERQWTRTPYGFNVWITDNGSANAVSTTYSIYGYRPCFTLPTTFTATYYVDPFNNIYPSQEYTTGGSITDVFGYDVPIAQIQEGTYQGTGIFGTSAPSTLTLPFIPKFVCITNQANPYIRAIIPYGAYGIVWNQNTATSTAISSFGLATTWTQDTITWYNTTNAQLQLNETGVTYNYVAFG